MKTAILYTYEHNTIFSVIVASPLALKTGETRLPRIYHLQSGLYKKLFYPSAATCHMFSLLGLVVKCEKLCKSTVRDMQEDTLVLCVMHVVKGDYFLSLPRLG